ncbi:hypothetical protein FACS18945_0730 [Bacteroidia bacterium]|nr:hypothetical protein FACS18945_0730 [Bacteroidia bacterium]
MENENLQPEEIEENLPAEEPQAAENECENCEVESASDNWEEKYNDLNDKHLRLVAEFDNYRKRTIREKADLLKSAGESILINILPIIDDFERGLKAMDESTEKEGIELIYNKFKSFLTQSGVKEIETENQPFNVDLHEAITTIPAPTEESKGKIIDCVSKGYMLNEKVIRFPKVVVGG